MKNRHPMAGKFVKIVGGQLNGETLHVEDWWENVAGKSWMTCDGNPACLDYAMRGAIDCVPIDDEVVYGKVGPFGKLVHVTHLGPEVEPKVRRGQEVAP